MTFRFDLATSSCGDVAVKCYKVMPGLLVGLFGIGLVLLIVRENIYYDSISSSTLDTMLFFAGAILIVIGFGFLISCIRIVYRAEDKSFTWEQISFIGIPPPPLPGRPSVHCLTAA